MAGIDDVIGQWVKQAESSGELKRSPFHGRRFEFDDGFERTPQEHRMSHKVLKNAGYVPYEVELVQQLAALQETLDATDDESNRAQLKKEIAEIRQKIAIRLEGLIKR